MSSRRVVRIAVGTLLALLLTALAAHVAGEERSARRVLEDRFRERAALSADHVATELDVLADRQRSFAMAELSATAVPADAADRAVTSLGLRSAVVVDRDGVVAASRGATPPAAAGPAVEALVHGARSRSVSDVVASVDGDEPGFDVTVPYAAGAGRRVLRATYDVRRTALTSFLRTASSQRGRVVHLVDAGGRIVASSAAGSSGVFATREPELAAAGARAQHVVRRGVAHTMADVPVGGTGWRLVVAAPRAELLEPLGRVALGPWTLVGGFLVVSVAVMVLIDRLFAQRDHLRRISTTDGLTGLVNRAHADAQLDAIARRAARTGERWAVLMIDVDHFKERNDRFGHAAGDRALRHLAAAFRSNLRADDLVARWGGEEFVIAMRGAGLADALGVGERLAAAVRRLPADGGMPLTVSIGVAAGPAADAEALVRSADQALYRAKANGRDRVEVDVPGDLRALTRDLPAAAP